MADAPDPQELARRYLDLWQQHLTHAATDPDLAAGMANLLQLMPNLSAANWPGALAETDSDGAAKRPAADAAASDGGSNGVDELVRRLESLEKRLDALEQGAGNGRKRPANGSGKRRS